MTTKPLPESLRNEIRKTNKFLYVVLFLLVFVGLPTTVWIISTPTTPKDNLPKETWVSMTQKPELICGSTFVGESEDGKLILGDNTQFDYIRHRYLTQEVRIKAINFSRKDGTSTPLWIIEDTRSKK